SNELTGLPIRSPGSGFCHGTMYKTFGSSWLPVISVRSSSSLSITRSPPPSFLRTCACSSSAAEETRGSSDSRSVAAPDTSSGASWAEAGAAARTPATAQLTSSCLIWRRISITSSFRHVRRALDGAETPLQVSDPLRDLLVVAAELEVALEVLERGVEPLQVQFVQDAQVVVCQGVAGAGCDSLHISRLRLQEPAASPLEHPELGQGGGMTRVESQCRVDVFRGGGVVPLRRHQYCQVDVCAGVIGVLQQESPELQFCLGRVAGGHRGDGLFVQRQHPGRNFRRRRASRRRCRRDGCTAGHQQRDCTEG